MKTIKERLDALGTHIPDILLPNKDIDLKSWAVIACDQFTQDSFFWDGLAQQIGEKPSLLSMIFPEIYLEDTDKAARIMKIRQAMKKAITSDYFDEPVHGMIYVERSTPHRPCRRGLVLALDLEHYDWHPEAQHLIRATEGTVQERLPPRIEIRRGAPLESPHIIVLIDDPERQLIEGLGKRAKTKPYRYSTQLMADAGRITGWVLDTQKDFEYLAEHLERLVRQAIARDGRTSPSAEPFLYAVGDGNHSLATAKAVWEEYKATHYHEPDIMEHPARYALVELENLYDEGIEFEPIHRLLFGTSLKEIEQLLQKELSAKTKIIEDIGHLTASLTEPSAHTIQYGLVSKDGLRLISISGTAIATAPIQPVLDRFISENQGKLTIDYIHGSRETTNLSLAAPDRVGILLPPVSKGDLFVTVGKSGPLPRKSFSMGEGIEKRFYLECRRLFV
ncbi:DUF1015 domain-containing protein [Gracilinema caldarium]|uniref:Uncharacterized conserved protein UCP033563 n=1 Tax=Gracilinema caldarium (strain ATCC 51460 / DSM 7334 / H1) TaxID=744872 RepID=F8F138_GRAC1|nr:DUF1015 domain-containing protein [Gracilinema caldarium]AEJ20828.1 Uncharacterized conserved protein UCP033563 [Gracilinema caldarium DSM 7334]